MGMKDSIYILTFKLFSIPGPSIRNLPHYWLEAGIQYMVVFLKKFPYRYQT